MAMKWVQRTAKVQPRKHDSLIDKVAKIRGIEDVDTFLSPQKDVLHDPYLMKNIEEASNRIIMAIANNEKIVVSYDPDADGLTSASMLIRHLRAYTENVDYIYGERGHGHGIFEMMKQPHDGMDAERVERQYENRDKVANCDLLILVDSSSNDIGMCRNIKELLGKEIIILDHHAIEQENPYVLMVNPQQEGCEYPNKQLSGAGVVFKTIQVMEDTLGQIDPWQYIDLVAVGMYADVMRVDVPENRYLIMQGLRNMKNTGLVRILKGAKADLFKLNCNDIGFKIAPIINGTARMDKIKLAIDILLEDDDKICKKLRLQMSKLNDTRKEKQKAIVEQYNKNIDTTKKVLIVMDEQSSKGFNGLVSQQLSDAYRRPVIVGRIHNGKLSGSFRSYNGFKFKSFLNGFDGEIKALGHEGAGGIEIAEEFIDDLQTYINRFMPSLEDTKPTILYDFELEADEVAENIKDIERFNLLTGNGFPKLVIKVNNITVEEQKCIGTTRETVKISTFDGIEMIKFRVNEHYASELAYFDVINVVGQISINEWYNFGTKQKVITNQIMLDDYELAEND
jgi:single-stranded-DNA-specific exonuclease